MKRRAAIRNVIVLGAGASWIVSCQGTTTPSETIKNIPITEAQEDMLAALTETIIPSNDFVGAKELGSSEFIILMAEDCASPDDQKKLMAGMSEFEDAFQNKYSVSFVKSTPEQRLEFLKAIEAKTGIAEEVVGFYQQIKSSTIQSFITSEEYLTKIKNFSLIPGPYQGCVPVKTV